MQLPRLGQISYINCLPVTLPIARGLVPIEAEVEFASPSELNMAYAAGCLDLGAMSTSFYLESGAMTLIPRLSIASDGDVGSVLFFYRREPSRHSSFSVAVPTASATSVCLLKVLFGEEFGFVCDVVSTMRPDFSDESIDGALVIGDYALAVDAPWSKLYARKDLGAWWKSRFGLPMVFGVWAARTAWAAQHQNEFERISEALTTSLEIGLGRAMPDVIAQARERTGLSAERLHHYYREELSYAFGEAHVQALRKYESLCQNYGLLARRLAEV
jgi:chorismate dehydratase